MARSSPISIRIVGTLAALSLALGAPAAAQVEVQPLAALDLFSAGSRETGFDADIWAGTSADVARQVIPVLAKKPLSPIAASLARRLLATASTAPQGAGADADLAAARAAALTALGDARTAVSIVERLPGLQSSPALSQAAAEAALMVGDDERACAIGQALSSGRDGAYWLRLRAYCQAVAGNMAAAELTLAVQGQKDPHYARLMGALITGAGDPGPASLRSGVELALTRRLGLEIGTPARKTASPAILAYLEGAEVRREAALDAGWLALKLTGPDSRQEVALLTAQLADAKAAPRYRSALLIAAALGAPVDRAALASLDGAAGPTPAGRLAAMDLAAEAGLKGETALHVLAICAETGGKAPHPADTARIVRALMKVGMAEEAIRMAQEGLGALQLP